MRRFPGLLIVLLLGAFAPVLAGAQSAPVVLTVSGRIAAPEAPRDFTVASLEALGAHTLRTTTPWTEGVQEFTGVRLRDLLAAVGAHGRTLTMTALNDYTVDIPAADAGAYDVIVAYRRNGEAMPVRDKGPLWIIYPLDHLRDREYQARMIWQLRRIDVH